MNKHRHTQTHIWQRAATYPHSGGRAGGARSSSTGRYGEGAAGSPKWRWWYRGEGLPSRAQRSIPISALIGDRVRRECCNSRWNCCSSRSTWSRTAATRAGCSAAQAAMSEVAS
eukprot:EG_transcript_30804